ncbi:hypothetical protein CSUI_009784 [Cystoisospora suis]|uniref:Transmembrane protein n=1 Tax=Cystoisospora suis TaxID=483139 RepID=A0A2C6KIS5_9APIC|nr:hypothetical protein CSUI_009784 [Cystoisospora suis]
MRNEFVADLAALAAASFLLMLPLWPAPLSSATDVLFHNRPVKPGGLADAVHVPRNFADGDAGGVSVAEEHSRDGGFQNLDGKQRTTKLRMVKRRSFSDLLHPRFSGRTPSTQRSLMTVPNLHVLTTLIAVAILVLGHLKGIVLKCLAKGRAVRQASAGPNSRLLSEPEDGEEAEDQTARAVCSALRADSGPEEEQEVGFSLVASHRSDDEIVDEFEDKASTLDEKMSRRDQVIERALLSWSGLVLVTALIVAIVGLILYEPKDSDERPPYNTTASAAINGSSNLSSTSSSPTIVTSFLSSVGNSNFSTVTPPPSGNITTDSSSSGDSRPSSSAQTALTGAQSSAVSTFPASTSDATPSAANSSTKKPFSSGNITTRSSSPGGSSSPSLAQTTLTSAPASTVSPSDAVPSTRTPSTVSTANATHSPSGTTATDSPPHVATTAVSLNQSVSSTVPSETNDTLARTPNPSSRGTSSPVTTSKQATSANSQLSNATRGVTDLPANGSDPSALSLPTSDASPSSSSPGSALTSPPRYDVPSSPSGEAVGFSENTPAPSDEASSPTPSVDTSASLAPGSKGTRYTLQNVYVNCRFKMQNLRKCYAASSPFCASCHYPITDRRVGGAFIQLRIPSWQHARLKKHGLYEKFIREFVRQIVEERWNRYRKGEPYNGFYMDLRSEINPYELQ